MCEKCEKTETAVERLAKYCKDQKISAPVYTQTHNVNGVVRVMCEVSGLSPVSQPGSSYDDAKEQAADFFIFANRLHI